ncbi:MAG: heat-inducible transcription repressor HrcA [Ignavibacteria bacterium]|nr:heat-inducible transcription repressor HrcA [Ignavibacteria bacterium]
MATGFYDFSDMTSRERLVLQHIIRQYISTANPVGSRTVSKQLELNLSPASIRNIMSDLEEKGMIGHPHTSAGRIPTDKGYRFYVDSIIQREILSAVELEFIDQRMDDQRAGNVEEIVRESGKVLSQISQQLAIVSTPHIGRGQLQHLELVPVATHRLMVVLSITSGFVKTIIFEINADIPRETLDQLASLLNERLCGLTLRDIRETFADRMRDAATDAPTLIELFLQSGDKLFADELDALRVYIDGMGVMTQQPEFGDADRLRNIIELVENRNIIVHVLDSFGGEDAVSIRIGSEIEEAKLHDYSIIAAPYRVGPVEGTISLIGPRRMDYPRMISIVDYLSKCISHVV